MTQKILVVDDKEKIRQIYKSLLTRAGYDVVEAHDGHRATNLLVTLQNIHLILLDIRMPLVDGVLLYEVAKQYDPDIKIIVTSVHRLEDQKRLIGRADDYYEKFQDTEVLLSKVKKVFNSTTPLSVFSSQH